jgi:hypothetical protein
MNNKATAFAGLLEILQAPAGSKNIDQPISGMTKKGASNRAFFVAASVYKDKTPNP